MPWTHTISFKFSEGFILYWNLFFEYLHWVLADFVTLQLADNQSSFYHRQLEASWQRKCKMDARNTALSGSIEWAKWHTFCKEMWQVARVTKYAPEPLANPETFALLCRMFSNSMSRYTPVLSAIPIIQQIQSIKTFSWSPEVWKTDYSHLPNSAPNIAIL